MAKLILISLIVFLSSPLFATEVQSIKRANTEVEKIKAEVKEIESTYAVCMDSAKSNVEMKQCTGEAYTQADKLLNKTYKMILGNYSDKSDEFAVEMKSRLTAAQRIWVQFKTAECRLQGMEMYQGTGESLVVTGCLYDKTKTRILDLTFWAIN